MVILPFDHTHLNSNTVLGRELLAEGCNNLYSKFFDRYILNTYHGKVGEDSTGDMFILFPYDADAVLFRLKFGI